MVILMSSSDVQLTVRDKINFPYLIAKLLSLIHEFMISQYAEVELIQAIEGLISSIPDDMKDKDFRDEMEGTDKIKGARIQYLMDIRPSWCGHVVDVEVCKELGIPIEEKAETLDPYMSLQACMNLFYRLGMLTKKVYIEFTEGLSFYTGEQIVES